MKMKEKEASQLLSATQFRKEDFNQEIGEAQIEKMIELKLLPRSKDDLGFRYVKYFPNDQLLDWRSMIARKIVRERGDVRLGDLLTKKERKLVSDVAEGKREGTQFQSAEVIQEFERVGQELGLRINRRWYVRTSEDDFRRIMPLTPYGYAAQTLFYAAVWKDNKDPESNYPRIFLERLKAPLRDIAKSFYFHIPSPNTQGDVKWRYIDQINGGVMPPIDLCKERLQVLRELNLLPIDPHFWSMLDGGSKQRDNQYKDEYLPEVDRLEKMRVPAEVFDKLKEIWFGEGFKDADKKGERINQTFFFCAYLLKKDYPGLYDWYLKEVKRLVFEKLISKPIYALKRERDDLERELKNQTFREDMMSEYASEALRLSDKQVASSMIEAGLRIKRRKGLARCEIRESGDLKEKQDQLEDVKQRYERKQKEWEQQILTNEAEIIRFKAWLDKDFFLGCVFYTYVLDGFKKLRLKRPAHRPSNAIIANMIVHLVDNLAPHLKGNRFEYKNRERVYGTVSKLLSGLTGWELGNQKVKDFYHRHKSSP